MTNSETRRWLERLHRDLAGRFDCFERKVTDRIGDLDGKLDAIQERCVGCAREFGEISQQAKTNTKSLDDHKRDHRWHAALAATIGGIIVGIAAFFARLFRD